jgi:hypothetical protein
MSPVSNLTDFRPVGEALMREDGKTFYVKYLTKFLTSQITPCMTRLLLQKTTIQISPPFEPLIILFAIVSPPSLS